MAGGSEQLARRHCSYRRHSITEGVRVRSEWACMQASQETFFANYVCRCPVWIAVRHREAKASPRIPVPCNCAAAGLLCKHAQRTRASKCSCMPCSTAPRSIPDPPRRKLHTAANHAVPPPPAPALPAASAPIFQSCMPWVPYWGPGPLQQCMSPSTRRRESGSQVRECSREGDTLATGAVPLGVARPGPVLRVCGWGLC